MALGNNCHSEEDAVERPGVRCSLLACFWGKFWIVSCCGCRLIWTLGFSCKLLMTRYVSHTVRLFCMLLGQPWPGHCYTKSHSCVYTRIHEQDSLCTIQEYMCLIEVTSVSLVGTEKARNLSLKGILDTNVDVRSPQTEVNNTSYLEMALPPVNSLRSIKCILAVKRCETAHTDAHFTVTSPHDSTRL